MSTGSKVVAAVVLVLAVFAHALVRECAVDVADAPAFCGMVNRRRAEPFRSVWAVLDDLGFYEVFGGVEEAVTKSIIVNNGSMNFQDTSKFICLARKSPERT